MDPLELIKEQAGKIRASGALGRSKSYARLFDYLVECTLAGRQPKELEIATDVFAKDSSFDPSQDSMVRVYAHNLRQKLKRYYDKDGSDDAARITIPRGEYRLALEEPAAEPATAPERGPRRLTLRLALAGGVLLLAAGALIGFWLADRGSAYDSVASSPLWDELLDDDIPILVVVGDYYIFGELDDYGNVSRFIREFSINSPQDLRDFAEKNPKAAERYRDLDVTYLASSSALALRDAFRVLFTSDKPVHVESMSQFRPEDLRNYHIVYVGYLSALDKLLDFVFAASSLSFGETYDELWDLDTGEEFRSTAGMPADKRNYRDYGLLSTFPGPAGNQFVIIAGTRDEGVMQAAQIASEPMYQPGLEEALPEGALDPVPSFELLYEVTGFDRTSIDSTLVHAARLNYHDIWLGDLLETPDEH